MTVGLASLKFGLTQGKNCPAPWRPCFFLTIWTIFELVQEINKTNVLTNFHDDWAKIVTSRVFKRKTAPPTGGHVFQHTGTTFELNQDIIKTNILTNYMQIEHKIFELGRDFIGAKLLKQIFTDGRTVRKTHLSNQQTDVTYKTMDSVRSWSVRVATKARRELLRSATLEPGVFHIAGIAVFSKMQRSRQPLFIVGKVPSITSVEEIRGGPRAAHHGTAVLSTLKRAGETVSGMKTTASDFERGHKGRAASCRPLETASRQKFVFEIVYCLPVHMKVSLATVH
ncbi:hypothetical protein DPMN_046705 [Dreissena polymorpha]|uniref:Uncharacterized protein n=1 Tax=Dreissena polymorpha TaxID=45954 RepID=A0A9D4D7C2_DREPO|nr:hypothetical protein DPMN_046705 [Dreissena polymorpha]